MNVVILMAGSSELFKDRLHDFPKSLIEIDNKPVAQHVVNGVQPFIDRGDKIIFVIKKEDADKYYLGNTLKLLAPSSDIVIVPGDTSGAAVTALLSLEHAHEELPLLIVNGDQVIEENLISIVHYFEKYDAGAVVFNSVHPRWSYVKCDKEGYIVESAEKKPISNLATAGFYYYKTANSYFNAAKKMILKGSSVDGLFYVCPVFNEMILEGKKIVTYKIDRNKYHSLMTPELVAQYQEYIKKV